jgi:hypothetical protein
MYPAPSGVSTSARSPCAPLTMPVSFADVRIERWGPSSVLRGTAIASKGSRRARAEELGERRATGSEGAGGEGVAGEGRAGRADWSTSGTGVEAPATAECAGGEDGVGAPVQAE